MRTRLDPAQLREIVVRAQLYLVFTPSACGERDPLEVLESVLPHVDLVQVRPKAAERGLDPSSGPGADRVSSSAREVYDWTRRVLELVDARRRDEVPVLVNDRVDVAASLLAQGCAGVHVGQDDTPPSIARALLGPDALIGFSTHDAAQVARAGDEPVDYLGFGPFHATATKGYARGLGAEACWIAHHAADVPVFPIGGISGANAGELARIGRAAVGAGVLAADDPAEAARLVRALLADGDMA